MSKTTFVVEKCCVVVMFDFKDLRKAEILPALGVKILPRR